MLPSGSDSEFIDNVFEHALDMLENGVNVTPAMFTADRPDLERQIHSSVEVARQMAFGASHPTPPVPGYDIVHQLGRGGMGVVYLAQQTKLAGRLVALKVLPPTATLTGSSLARFKAEAHAIASIRHPHIVPIYDVVSEPGIHAYAMEWVDGKSLDQITQAIELLGRAPSIDDILRIIRFSGHHGPARHATSFFAQVGIEISLALQAVHDAGLIHRDVKPANILVRRDGTSLLSDFGLVRSPEDAHLTQEGEFAGTPAYSSPEQLRCESELTAQTDIYSLGLTLYHTLSGRLPYSARTPRSTLRRVESGRVPPLCKIQPTLPRDLGTIVDKAISAEPKDRYDSAASLADDLDRLLALRPIRARPCGLLTKCTKLARRNKAAALGATVGGAGVLLLAALGIVYVLWLPGWMREQVSHARTHLLSPLQSELMYIHAAGLNIIDARWHETAKSIAQDYATAIEHYDRAIWIPRLTEERRRWQMERDVVNLARLVLLAIVNDEEPPQSLNITPLPSAPITTELARGWIANGTITLPNDLLSSSADTTENWSLGLLALLCGNPELGERLWTASEWTLGSEPDPLVDAFLGTLYVTIGESGKAIGRLERARSAAPASSFLYIQLAEANIQEQEPGTAEQYRLKALSAGYPDEFGTARRLQGDYYRLTGKTHEALDIYNYVTRVHSAQRGRWGLATLHWTLGRRRDALRVLCSLAGQNPTVAVYQTEFIKAADAWWGALDVHDRLEAITSGFGESHRGASGLRALLLQYQHSSLSLAGLRQPVSHRIRMPPVVPPEDCAHPSYKVAHPAAALTVADLADRLQPKDAQTWLQLRRAHQSLRNIQAHVSASSSSPKLFGAALVAQPLAALFERHTPAIRYLRDQEPASTIGSCSYVLHATIDGIHPGDNFGLTGVRTGNHDIDHDGTPDVIIAAPTTLDERGYIAVFSGRELAEASTTNVLIAVQHGLAPGDRFGSSIAVGDLTGNETPEILVGAPQPSVHGSGYLAMLSRNSTTKSNCLESSEFFFGPDGSGFGTHLSLSGYRQHEETAVLVGSQREVWGQSLLSISSSDGHARRMWHSQSPTRYDWQASNAILGASNEGRAYLIAIGRRYDPGLEDIGKVDVISIDAVSGKDKLRRFLAGPPGLSGFGSGMLLVPDLNRDGYADVLVAANGEYDSSGRRCFDSSRLTVVSGRWLAEGSGEATFFAVPARGVGRSYPAPNYCCIGDINNDGGSGHRSAVTQRNRAAHCTTPFRAGWCCNRGLDPRAASG